MTWTFALSGSILHMHSAQGESNTLHDFCRCQLYIPSFWTNWTNNVSKIIDMRQSPDLEHTQYTGYMTIITTLSLILFLAMCSPIKAYSIWISRTRRIIFSGNILQFLLYNFVFGHRHVLFSWHAESKLSTLTQTWWDALVRMYGKCCSHLVFTQNHDCHVTRHSASRSSSWCQHPLCLWESTHEKPWGSLLIHLQSGTLTDSVTQIIITHCTGHRSLASTSALSRLQKSTEGKSCVQFLLLLL